MTTILVTGADGQLGSCIQKKIKNSSKHQFTFHDSGSLNIEDAELVDRTFANSSFDYCINCAAFTDVELAEKTPERAYAINALGVKNLAEACSKYGTVLIHLSTDYVFDGEKESPYYPEDQTNPLNVYGSSKLKGEEHILALLERYFIIRTSWLYSEFGNNFYKTILKKAKAGEDLKVIDDEVGCPTNANHLAAFILELIESGSEAFGVHHFTDQKPMTWYDFAKQILLENDLENKVKLDKAKNYRTFVRRPKNSVLAQ